jgi:hypothetical protein
MNNYRVKVIRVVVVRGGLRHVNGVVEPVANLDTTHGPVKIIQKYQKKKTLISLNRFLLL